MSCVTAQENDWQDLTTYIFFVFQNVVPFELFALTRVAILKHTLFRADDCLMLDVTNSFIVMM